MQPTLGKMLVDHRGPTSSEAYNKFQEAALYDINKLFNIAAAHEIEIPRNMEISMVENCFLQMRIAALESALADLEAGLTGTTNRISFSFTDSSNVVYGGAGYTTIASEKQARVAAEYGIATLPGSYINKVGLTGPDGTIVVPATLGVTARITLSPTASLDDITATFEETMLNMFDGQVDTYWVNAVATSDTSVSKARARIEIAIPQDITNNLLTNTIILHPYPEYGLTINDIQYLDSSGTWQRIPTFPVASGQPVPITTAKRMQVIYDSRQITKLRVDFEQPYWFKEAGQRVFRFGFQEIGIGYMDYRPVGTLLAKIALPAGTYFGRIDRIAAKNATGSPSDIGSAVTTQLYITDPTTSTLRVYSLGYPLPGGVNTIYVETTLQRTTSGASPGVERLEVSYTTT